MVRALRVTFYGAGQVGTAASAILRGRAGYEVFGPFGREQRDAALRSGAHAVVIATTSFLAGIADDVRDAVEAGSNVLTTAEEAASPWANDPETAGRLDALARSRGVTILGAGVNPGFAFDGLVLTASGVVPEVESLVVERVVDLSGFGANILRQLGIAHTAESFEAGRRAGTVTGHVGFPQSMNVVAGGLGVTIDRIDREIEPLFTQTELQASSLTIAAGLTAGVRQRYAAMTADARTWFEALFIGHVAPAEIGLEPRDSIRINGPRGGINLVASPGINPQIGSSSVVANSIRRLVDARPGWITIADLPPAVPR
jgi:4-hydroxy-tetrahydrodipicolinate reductase